MKVGIYLPIRVYRQLEAITKIVAEGLEGYFTLLPRHIDYIAILVPGILTLADHDGQFSYFAVDQGTLIKVGETVSISTRNCVQGEDLATLADIVDKEFKELDDLERKTRTALTGLEHSMIRRLREMRKQ